MAVRTARDMRQPFTEPWFCLFACLKTLMHRHGRKELLQPISHPPAQVIQMMEGLEQALGVTYEHCHVDFGRNDPKTDLAIVDKTP